MNFGVAIQKSVYIKDGTVYTFTNFIRLPRKEKLSSHLVHRAGIVGSREIIDGISEHINECVARKWLAKNIHPSLHEERNVQTANCSVKQNSVERLLNYPPVRAGELERLVVWSIKRMFG